MQHHSQGVGRALALAPARPGDAGHKRAQGAGAAQASRALAAAGAVRADVRAGGRARAQGLQQPQRVQRAAWPGHAVRQRVNEAARRRVRRVLRPAGNQRVRQGAAERLHRGAAPHVRVHAAPRRHRLPRLAGARNTGGQRGGHGCDGGRGRGRRPGFGGGVGGVRRSGRRVVEQRCGRPRRAVVAADEVHAREAEGEREADVFAVEGARGEGGQQGHRAAGADRLVRGALQLQHAGRHLAGRAARAV